METLMNKSTQLMLSLSLGLGCATLAAAAVEVRFVDPDQFVDIGDVARDRQQTLQLIEGHLKARANKLLPGKDLSIEVTNIDLAGELWPVGLRMEMIRLARPVGRPMIALRYVLSQDGRELRSGESRMMDLDYLHGINRYVDNDPIRYE